MLLLSPYVLCPFSIFNGYSLVKVQRMIVTMSEALHYYLNEKFHFKSTVYSAFHGNLNSIDRDIFYDKAKVRIDIESENHLPTPINIQKQIHSLFEPFSWLNKRYLFHNFSIVPDLPLFPSVLTSYKYFNFCYSTFHAAYVASLHFLHFFLSCISSNSSSIWKMVHPDHESI